ncbi:hypothetical protein K227x_27770 [Rubripirellula lacrimiformis]|uniref:Uncharacterized protein n=1 Tax=Rubripirellula lacrimiformis TaxID=1930273 RepID=A0A517NB74_9BACT|nr:hypothetical protein K227x_27770 [Rubripirellula lacrimiformis]
MYALVRLTAWATPSALVRLKRAARWARGDSTTDVRVGSFNRLGNAQRAGAAETGGPMGTRLNDDGCTRSVRLTAWATPSALVRLKRAARWARG